ncbi:unnamed protein product [Linum tenue]|uniref:Cysteine-rich receptor-like protein kinase 29 n=1 Tax=Linum tenue TaxID=586396 RepID=A0AAV0JB39_9ROSI|nr:unnamed protein product [Linum tenue]
MNPPLLALLILLPLPCCRCIFAQPSEFRLLSCYDGAGNYTAGSTYRRNLDTLLSSLAADYQTTTGFYNLSVGLGPDRVNAMGLCRADISLQACRDCISEATTRLVFDCPVQKTAFGHYGNTCQLRYSNRSIYGSLEPDPPSLYLGNFNNASDPVRFGDALRALLVRLRGSAAEGSSVRKFATGAARQGSLTIYGLVQCSPDLSRQLCDECIAAAARQIDGRRIGGQIWQPCCRVGYETHPFYSDAESPQPAAPGTGKQLCGRSKNTTKIAAVVIPIAGAAVLGFIFILFFCRRSLKRSRIPIQTDEIGNEGCLQFDFETIRVATNDFSQKSKLGEGGFGVVYKGTLSNGQEVAVKRLKKDSAQGHREFKNEVKLVAKLEHRNLVKLLGFCLKGGEMLLIYEFIPNASLDHFLFDVDKKKDLSWERRYKIIIGVTRGMTYLHEESRLRIIHRDLKASNILLDAEMVPKISDFGMARLFDTDETRAITNRIVGTYGYMAPEYAMHGQFSVKSDVFSFGVFVLEIVSSKKNKHIHGNSSMKDLLSYAWRNWRNGTYTNLVDPSLGNNFSGAEVARCIHIGLLCVQENVNDRPTMAAVALMLTRQSIALPLPSKPAFFVHTGTGDQGSSSSSRDCYRRSTSRGGITDHNGGSSPPAEALPLSRNEVSVSELYPR